MTRLEILCLIHNQAGGTIHQFNNLYGVDLLSLSDAEFNNKIQEQYRQGLYLASENEPESRDYCPDYSQSRYREDD